MKHLRGIVFLAAIAAACLGGSQAAAQDQLTLRTNFYYAAGNSVREIRESMAKAKPRQILHDAQTDWHIDWKFSSGAGEADCTIDALTVRTSITTTLPRWAAGSNAPPELLKRWKEYREALEKHETHHRLVAEQAAKALRSELLRLQGPCATFSRTVTAAADKILAEYKKREADYDLKTEHGIAEGAHFP